MKSLREQISCKCVHFNGIMNNECKVGIKYADVRVDKPYKFPCLQTGGFCDKSKFRTEDEVTQEIEEIETGGIWAITTILKVR